VRATFEVSGRGERQEVHDTRVFDRWEHQCLSTTVTHYFKWELLLEFVVAAKVQLGTHYGPQLSQDRSLK
jgi:hypothetical protein